MKTKAEAEYRKATGDERCGNCSMFRYPHDCTLVQGVIRTSDTCKYWEAK